MSAVVTRQPSFPLRIGIAAALAGGADFLLYDQPVALSLLVLFFLVGVTAIALHPASLLRGVPIKSALLVAALAPLAENVSALSVFVATTCLASLALSASDRLGGGFRRVRNAVTSFLLLAPFRLIGDLFRWRRAVRRLGGTRLRFAALAAWIMPLCLGVVFLALFGAANPVIDYWLSLIDLWKLFQLVAPERVVFWLLALALIWGFLRPRLPFFFRRVPRIFVRQAPPAPAAELRKPSAAHNFEEAVFGKAAILRALVLFNAMFAVQTGLDLTYLWGGAALPDGLTYASYAHRGAYPLIATALLAAAFVLAALKPGSATSGDRLIRGLVHAWIGQNIMLVISSIFRLDLYVGIYALTYWRIAAFIWMGLVAAGLSLIIARIALGKSNRWLLSANLSALSATLYGCCFINFAALIADYNVDHSFEMSGQGVPLDSWYLRDLGPAAFPAIDRLLAGRILIDDPVFSELSEQRTREEAWYRDDMRQWRAWSLRDWRLLRYLDRHAAGAAPSGTR